MNEQIKIKINHETYMIHMRRAARIGQNIKRQTKQKYKIFILFVAFRDIKRNKMIKFDDSVVHAPIYNNIVFINLYC